MKSALHRWFDTLAPFLALGGLAGSLVSDYLSVRTWDVPGTDFKTLFAAVRLFAQGHDPYSNALLPGVFHADGVIEPASWFGHMPVYPPFTLAILRPLAAFNMATASWIWFVLSAVLMALALGAMLRWSREELNLTLPWRIALLGVSVACPLVAFALEIGNVSTVVAALCMLAFFLRGNPILRGVLLAIALLLKPHLAIWLLIAMLASRLRSMQLTAVWATTISALFVALSSAWLAVQGTLASTWQSYRSMLAFESTASMSARSHEALPIGAQITSIWSLAEYVTQSPIILAASLMLLLCYAACIFFFALRYHSPSPASATLLASCCIAFGMIATYHRAHDAQLFLIALPLAFASLRGKQPDREKLLNFVSAALLIFFFVGMWFAFPISGEFWQLRQASVFAISTGLFGCFCAFFALKNQKVGLKKQKKDRYER